MKRSKWLALPFWAQMPKNRGAGCAGADKRASTQDQKGRSLKDCRVTLVGAACFGF